MKKDSQTIHRENAERTARHDKGRKKGRSYSVGPSKKQENPLTNPIAQLFAFAIRSHNRQARSRPKAYEHRRR